MNVRKHILAGALAFGLVASIIAPTATAQDSDDSAPVTVEIASGGTFYVMICNPDVPVDTPGLIEANVSLSVALEDRPTILFDGLAKGSFYVCYWDDAAQRGGFVTTLRSSNFTSEGKPEIPASLFSIVRTGHIQTAPIVTGGAIEYVVDGNAVAASPQVTGGTLWTANASLGANRIIHVSQAGPGIGAGGGEIEVELVIPNGTVAGNYEAELTVDVIPAP